jgi:hypothetical protein
MAGLDGKRKCTYFFYTTGLTYAPAINLSTLAYSNFQLHFAEWDDDALNGAGKGGFLPSASVANYYLGSYSDAKTGGYPNPIKADTNPVLTGWTKNDNAFTEWAVPGDTPPGDVDVVAYYPYLTGPFKELISSVKTTYMARVIDDFATYQTMYNNYDTNVNTYTPKANEYNTKLREEKARQEDIFLSIFDAEIAVPQRPCAPNRPPAYPGRQLFWDTTTGGVEAAAAFASW